MINRQKFDKSNDENKSQKTKSSFPICRLIMTLLVCAALSAVSTKAATFTVTNLNDSGAGSLRQAILDANQTPDDDVIEFQSPLFDTAQTIILTTGELTVQNNGTLTLDGPGADKVTISGNNASRVFYINPGARVEIAGVTISDGAALSGGGGGIYNYGTLTLKNSTVSNNSAVGGSGIRNDGTLTVNNSIVSDNSSSDRGGGIYNIATATVNNSIITGNTATYSGGGIFNYKAGTMTLHNSTVSNNSPTSGGGAGGGIRNDGSLTLHNSTVSDNWAGYNGGGIFNYNGNLTVHNSTVSGNSANTGPGGGIENNAGTITLHNSTVSGNSAAYGGAILNYSGTLTLHNSTFSDNTATTGGGIYDYFSMITLNNSIIANSTGGDCYGPGITASHSLVEDGTCGVTSGVNGNLTGDPNLGPLADNGGPTLTHELLTGSPSIDAGSDALAVDQNNLPLTTDQRGAFRISRASVDIGAFESGSKIFTVNTTADTDDGICDPADCSLREAMTAANAASTDDVIFFKISSGDPGYDAENDRYTITLRGIELAIINAGKLKIDGPGAGMLTISGNNASRVFYLNPGARAEINGATISNGKSRSGGGIIINGGTVTLHNSTVSGNSAPIGGGIYNYGGTVTLHNSTVSGNSAPNGNGGGILNNFNSILTLHNSTVSGNSARYGGGILSVGTVTLHNSTISGNSTPIGSGGGIYTNGGTVTLNNSIIANSSFGGDCFGSGTVLASYSLVEDGTCGVTGGVNGNQTGDPNLGPLADNGGPTMTHALSCSSPVVNTGNQALMPASMVNDQRGAGFSRIFDSTVDIGAFELQHICNTAPTITANAVSVAADSSGNQMVAAVNDAEDKNGDLSVSVDGSSFSNGVTVSNLAVDAAGNVTADLSATCAASDAAFTLKVTDSGNLTATGTLNVMVTPEIVFPVIDPVNDIELYLPPNSNAVSMPVSFSTPTASDNCGGLTVMTTPASGSQFPVGTTTVQVTATDQAGNQSFASFTVTVLYRFQMVYYSDLLLNEHGFNQVTAGGNVPVRFSLSGYKGDNPYSQAPTSEPISCSTLQPTGAAAAISHFAPDPYYSSLYDFYQTTWRTQASWRFTCRRLTLHLNDGTTRTLDFYFK